VRGGRDRRELEVLHRLAVSLPRSLTVTGVTDALAEGLVDAIERACECTITSWERDANMLTVLSVCEPGGIEPDWRGVVYDLADWPESLAVLEAGSEHREFRLSDASLEPRVREQVEEWTWASWICFPLVVEKRAVGLIELPDYDSPRAVGSAGHQLRTDDRDAGCAGRPQRPAVRGSAAAGGSRLADRAAQPRRVLQPGGRGARADPAQRPAGGGAGRRPG